jgi:ribosomal protein L11 methyltransferase
MSRWIELAYTVPIEDAEIMAERLISRGASGVEERDASTIVKAPDGKVALVVWIAPEAVETFLEHTWRFGEVQTRERDDEEWRDAWKKYFGVRRVGRFVLVPSWEKFEAAKDDLVIDLDPGRAFGTGGHPSTRLCLTLIGRIAHEGRRVLDVGCGSGILSIAAALRWPEARGLGVDLDAEAAEVSRENAARNRVDDRLAFSGDGIEQADGKYDLVLANIHAEVLTAIRDELVARLAPGGRLILAGILVEQADAVRAAFGELSLIEQLDEEGWRALALGPQDQR